MNNAYRGVAAVTGELLDGDFYLTQPAETDQIMQNAEEAFRAFRKISGKSRAAFLNAIAEEIEELGEELVKRTMLESGLPVGRIMGERGRTMNQLKAFAAVAEKGEWVEASIDTAQPNREPFPKSDIRRQLEPVGPVVVFGASNFPLAFSTAGGDTSSALASGCPVVLKVHPAHPGCSELVATAIYRAAERTGMPEHVFQHVHSTGFETGMALIQHPLTASVAFTGSFAGGKALFDAANKREKPIPVFAEMGSINPVLLLPEALKKGAEKWGSAYAGSITLGCGQFCTNPGLLIGIESPELELFKETLVSSLSEMDSQQMLHDGISSAYNNGKQKLIDRGDVTVLFNRIEGNKRLGGACLATVNGTDFIGKPQLQKELFGPFSLLVVCQSEEEMLEVIEVLEGQLTATVIGEIADVKTFENSIDSLKERVGRLIFNGVPTGVEVCPSMHHGGPYPATTDNRFTSVGTGAIKRFARPVCYQDWPHEFLPDALKNENPLAIYRELNGAWSNSAV